MTTEEAHENIDRVEKLVNDWPLEWTSRSVSFSLFADRAGVDFSTAKTKLANLKKKLQYSSLICFQKATGAKVNTHVFLRCENSLKEPPVATSALEQLGPRYAPLSSSTDTPSFLFLRSLSSARLPSLL
jgi:hypothetical protein